MLWYATKNVVFFLPGVKTLKLIVRRINIGPGFHASILKGLKVMSASIKESEKLVVLTVDEMATKENVVYDSKNDCIEGVENFGDGETSHLVANHACVFMVRGLMQKWKQPVGYFFSSGPMAADLLKSKLLSCIGELESIGLNVKVVVCDQGSNNRSMMKSLGVTVDSPHFEMNGKSLHVLYDPPHLLKNICNNLKKSGFMVGDNRVDWSHILTYFEIDSSLPIRMAPRLTERDIELPAFSSMKVRRMVISSSLNSAKSLHLRFLEESPCSCTKSLHGF